MPKPPLIQGQPRAVNPRTVEHALQQIIAHIDEPRDRATVSIGAEGAATADTRRLTFQLRDRNKFPRPERLTCRVWIAEAEDGPPTTAQTVAIATGVLVEEIETDSQYVILTDASGLLALDVAVSGAGTRYVSVQVVGRRDTTDGIGWAA